MSAMCDLYPELVGKKISDLVYGGRVGVFWSYAFGYLVRIFCVNDNGRLIRNDAMLAVVLIDRIGNVTSVHVRRKEDIPSPLFLSPHMAADYEEKTRQHAVIALQNEKTALKEKQVQVDRALEAYMEFDGMWPEQAKRDTQSEMERMREIGLGSFLIDDVLSPDPDDAGRDSVPVIAGGVSERTAPHGSTVT